MLAEPLFHLGEQYLHDAAEMAGLQRVEDNDLVDPVQELRPEGPLQLVLNRRAQPGWLVRLPAAEARGGAAQLGRTEVACHYHEGVAEVYRSALTVGQPAVLHDLEEDIEDIGMGFLDLVEEHDPEGSSTDGLGELATLFESDVSRRRADEPGDCVLLHVLRHVEPDDVLLIVEQVLGQGPGELGLSHAGGPEEDEAPDGPVGVLETGPRPADGVGDGADRVVLAHHAGVQPVLHVEQAFRLTFQEAVDGDAGPRGDQLPYVLGRHGHVVPGTARGLAATGLELFLDTETLCSKIGRLLVVGPLRRGFLLVLQPSEACFLFLKVAGQQLGVDPQLAGGLVNQVDRLIGKKPVGDVAPAEPHGSLQGGVFDRYLVVGLVPGPQGVQHLDGGLRIRLLDEDGLEAALEGGILFDALAVLLLCSGADALELSPPKRGLHHVPGVERSLRRASADDGVNLVDEEDDLTGGLPDLVHDCLEALFELAPELRTGDHRAHIEREHPPALQLGGDVAGDDALREALSDGGLSDAGTAYQHRVVLRAADQRLHGAGDLDIAPYDGVQPSTLGKLGQVNAEPFQRLIAALGPGVVDSVAASDLPQGLIDALQLDPELAHDAADVALVFLHEGHQQVLGPNELVV